MMASFGVPTTPGPHSVRVKIRHDDSGMRWNRYFDEQEEMNSLFVPHGASTGGHWIEETGPIRLAMTVDIINGSWHWRCQKIWLRGIPVPMWMLPQSVAYKFIEGGRYRFCVSFSLPLVGKIFSYGGLLQANIFDH